MNDTAKISRNLLALIVAGAIVAAIVALLLPRPVPVDLEAVQRGPLSVSIVEEGRTNVRERYIVSTPVAGRLMRVQLHPGDEVEKDETIVARMRPTNPAVLDSRTREQAEAAVEAAAAAVRLASANLNAAAAEEEFAKSELDRSMSLFESEIVSKVVLDRARSAHRASVASRETAEAAIAMREAELANARAHLLGADDIGLATAIAETSVQDIPLRSPIDGRVLQVFLESETVLNAGTPIMEIGDIASDLEVVVELISSDAVQVSVGDPVILRDWGGPNELAGEVVRIDPFGISRTSALGIDEQRVRVDIDLTSAPGERLGLGHGYRLEAAIVVWSAADVLLVPTSALFRTAGQWSAFKLEAGEARLVKVDLGKMEGPFAEVKGGLEEGDKVVIYPSAAVVDGTRVEERSSSAAAPD